MLIIKNVQCSSLNDFEKKIGMELPQELRHFIEAYNGGETPNTKVISKNVSTDIHVFYGLGVEEYSLDNIRCFDKNENKFLPIAIDSFGNEFCIDLKGNNSIWFCDHEKGNKMIYVADSLKEFISNCESETIKDSARKTPEEREQILLSKGKGANITDGLRQMWKDEYEKYSNCTLVEVDI